MTFSAAQADRPACQRLAATELATVLDSHPELPCIAWTAGPAGSVVAGRVSGGGETAWLHAADRSGAVTIRLTAAVPGDDGEAR